MLDTEKFFQVSRVSLTSLLSTLVFLRMTSTIESFACCKCQILPLGLEVIGLGLCVPINLLVILLFSIFYLPHFTNTLRLFEVYSVDVPYYGTCIGLGLGLALGLGL